MDAESQLLACGQAKIDTEPSSRDLEAERLRLVGEECVGEAVFGRRSVRQRGNRSDLQPDRVERDDRCLTEGTQKDLRGPDNAKGGRRD